MESRRLKGAPDFVAWPDPVSGVWKQSLLIWLGQVCDIDILVETGTCEGATPLAVHHYFEEIHTIELHPGLLEIAKSWIGHFPNVFMYAGSSVTWLPYIINGRLKGLPMLFWLDAHSSGPHTAQDEPLPLELAIITRTCPDALIVIDDQKDDTVPGEFPGWHREFRTGEIIMYKEGRYTIPPFD
jgi:hypothetical protein